MKLATFNIQYGTGADGQRPSAQLLLDTANELAAWDLDAIALQEVDNFHPRSGFEHQAEVLAEALGMNYHRVRTGFGTGLAVLSPHPIESAHDFTLPKVTSAVRRTASDFLGGWRIRPEQQRKVAYTKIWIDDERPLVFASSHFEARSETNRVQLALAIGAFNRILDSESGDPGEQCPLVLAGDFNMSPALVRDVLGSLPETLADAGASRAVNEPGVCLPTFSPIASGPTFRADSPSSQIDHILVAGLTSTASEAVRLPISDHRALIAHVDRASA